MDKEMSVRRVEDLCYQLRDAMLDFSLKFPAIASFKRSLQMVPLDDLEYLLELFHMCWTFYRPEALFNRPRKDDTEDQQAAAENIFKIKQSETPQSIQFKSVSPLVSRYYQELQYRKKLSSELSVCYGSYMNELHQLVKTFYASKGFVVKDDFSLGNVIHTNLSLRTLQQIYDGLADKYGWFEKTDDQRARFLSIFDTCVTAVEGKVRLTNRGAKNDVPCCQEIYTVFKGIGLKMTAAERAIIARFFETIDGDCIKPEQLRSRGTAKQKEVLAFINQIITNN